MFITLVRVESPQDLTLIGYYDVFRPETLTTSLIAYFGTGKFNESCQDIDTLIFVVVYMVKISFLY